MHLDAQALQHPHRGVGDAADERVGGGLVGQHKAHPVPHPVAVVRQRVPRPVRFALAAVLATILAPGLPVPPSLEQPERASAVTMTVMKTGLKDARMGFLSSRWSDRLLPTPPDHDSGTEGS